MAESEALREALLELDVLRQREAEALAESNALLKGLAAMNAAPAPTAALDALLAAVRETMECSGVGVLLPEGDDLVVDRENGSLPFDRLSDTARRLLSKPRRVSDLAGVRWWSGGGATRSWLSVPLRIERSVASATVHGSQPGVLACVDPRPDRFDPVSQRRLERLARLASQALGTRALAERNALLAAVIEGSSVALSIADARGGERPLIYVNPAFETLTGFRAAEVLGRDCRLLSAEEPDAPERARLRAAVRTRQGGRFELRNRRATGELFWNDLTLYPVAADGGGPGYLVATQVDATEQRAAEDERRRGETERARLMAQLAQAQRQEAVGVVAAGIAHDLNNVASVVAGSAELLLSSDAVEGRDRHNAERISRAGRSMSDLIARLLDFGKRAPDRSRIDLCEVVREAAELLRPTLGDGALLLTQVPDEAVRVVADPTDVLQIVLNLAINARDALPAGQGAIEVGLAPLGPPDVPESEIAVGAARADETYARIWVRDTGEGIARERHHAIFDPYHSSKGDGGTGLGLAVVAGLVGSMAGFVRLVSAPGDGTTFEVHLPPTPDAGPVAAAETDDSPTALAGRLVLVLDDDPDAVAVTSQVLEMHGAEVAGCEHPFDALAAIDDDPDAFDLVITDLEMPDLNGAEVAARLRERRPDLPIILQTGRRDWRNLVPDAPFATALVKPVSGEQLASAAAAAIAGRAGGAAR